MQLPIGWPPAHFQQPYATCRLHDVRENVTVLPFHSAAAYRFQTLDREAICSRTWCWRTSPRHVPTSSRSLCSRSSCKVRPARPWHRRRSAEFHARPAPPAHASRPWSALRPPHYLLEGAIRQMTAARVETALQHSSSRRRDFGHSGLHSAHQRLPFLLNQACATTCSAAVHRCVVPSIHMRCRSTAILRARAIFARFKLRRLATSIAQRELGSVFG